MKDLLTLVHDLSQLKEVETIFLGGSRATSANDEQSDYDVYCVINESIPFDVRRQLLTCHGYKLEIGNTAFGDEDACYLHSSGTLVEIIYWPLSFLKEQFENTFIHYKASTGYSTCFIHTLLKGEILFDRHEQLGEWQTQWNSPYPPQLKEAIISLNLPLLRNASASFQAQLQKAAKRGDIVSLNHRTAAFLSSYFDIIFAINEIYHPGEKRLLSFVNKHCSILPQNWEKHVHTLLEATHTVNEGAITKCTNEMIDELEKVLK